MKFKGPDNTRVEALPLHEGDTSLIPSSRNGFSEYL